MKLSTALLGTMLVTSTVAFTQQKNPVRKIENDSLKKVKRLVIPETKGVKRKVNTLKVEPVDSTKVIPIEIDHDYCPPCGMG